MFKIPLTNHRKSLVYNQFYLHAFDTMEMTYYIQNCTYTPIRMIKMVNSGTNFIASFATFKLVKLNRVILIQLKIISDRFGQNYNCRSMCFGDRNKFLIVKSTETQCSLLFKEKILLFLL